MTKRTPADAALTDWQRQAIAGIEAIATQQPNELRVSQPSARAPEGSAVLKIQLRTSDLPIAPGGLALQDHEEFVVSIPTSPVSPPRVDVEHARFVGYPHVLQGQRLCIYLDPSREWNPGAGIAGFLDRLWGWLADAAAARFDASTALYHAVGGVLHHTAGTPTLVIREPGPTATLQKAYLKSRSEHRLDVTFTPHCGDEPQLPVIALAADLPFGASSTLATLLGFIDDPHLDRVGGRAPSVAPLSRGLLTALAASATRNLPDTPQYFILAVPNPVGGPPHLLGGRLPVTVANSLRHLVATHGAALNIDPAFVSPSIPVEWCNVSDERPEVTTRRDDSRPVSGFRGRRLHVWGCGGLGSWIAEFAARAGAAHITICDPGQITGGLLVRQNYVEEDVGDLKVHALARRLRSISDGLTVDAIDGALPPDGATIVTTTDVVIDATVSIAIGQYLDMLAAIPGRTAIFAQVATDTRSGTLGILNLSSPSNPITLTEIDQSAGAFVSSHAELELYASLWQEPLSGHELVPTRGCSVPTFHGSSADLAAVAASAVSLLGMHLLAPTSGTHLMALPHADAGPRHRFIAA